MTVFIYHFNIIVEEELVFLMFISQVMGTFGIPYCVILLNSFGNPINTYRLNKKPFSGNPLILNVIKNQYLIYITVCLIIRKIL